MAYPPINDEKNLMVLRRDVHYLFDHRRLVFVPKIASSDSVPQLVTHVLLPEVSSHTFDLYHNRAPQPVSGISREFLLARFAWSIFTDEILPFFQVDIYKYNVLLFENGQTTVEELSGGKQVKDRATIFGPASSSRSVSPKKRAREQEQEQGRDSETADDWDPSSGESSSDDEETRGRSRTRKPRVFKRCRLEETAPLPLAWSMSTRLARATSTASTAPTSQTTAASSFCEDETGRRAEPKLTSLLEGPCSEEMRHSTSTEKPEPVGECHEPVP